MGASDRELTVDGEGLLAELARWRRSKAPALPARWWLSFGAAPLLLLAVQGVTGVLLALHYHPSAAEAYRSTQAISEQLSYGWFLRGLHRWAATLMIATALLHQLRVLLTGAYQAPRRATWLFGWLALLGAVAACFTGEFLTGQHRGVQALLVGVELSAEVPGVGPALRRLLLGGAGLGEATWPRIYAVHGILLPGLIAALAAVHLVWVRRWGSAATQTAAPGGGGAGFGPSQLGLDLCVGLGWLLLVTVLATVDAGTLSPSAAAAGSAEPVRAHWYALPLVRWVRLVPASVAAWTLYLAVAIVAAWPWLETRLFDGRLGASVGLAGRGRAAAAGVAALVLGLGIWEAVSGP
ncbi:MAG: cytochrome bc complex cytochrome b subunit [Deltaproteobacteria bacterium]|nr:cytochrome bc complex cytochrome b subunit [Deltaproteobacteria bacterium]MBW2533527.1 cytochrome bc complex cytochrome b subunit [Deltaproteobacteria bacterium]